MLPLQVDNELILCLLPKLYDHMVFFSHKEISEKQHTIEVQRLNTFLNWPSNFRYFPEYLVKHGFFVSKNGFICFYCGFYVKEWTDTKTPLISHFEECKLFLYNKQLIDIKKNDRHIKFTRPLFSREDVRRKKYILLNDNVDRHLCKVCTKHIVEIVFLPCAHMYLCQNCYRSINIHICNMCMSDIYYGFKVYIN